MVVRAPSLTREHIVAALNAGTAVSALATTMFLGGWQPILGWATGAGAWVLSACGDPAESSGPAPTPPSAATPAG